MTDQPGTSPSDAQLPFESVLEDYQISRFPPRHVCRRQPDSPYPGACAFVEELDPDRCAPYVEAAVPDDPAKILAADDDADVQCATAVRSVDATFSSKLVPVADSEADSRCFSVEAERQLQLRFSVSYGKVVNDFDGRRPSRVRHDRREVDHLRAVDRHEARRRGNRDAPRVGGAGQRGALQP